MTSYEAIEQRIKRADDRYGPFASTHEAMGVALEEWDELRDAIKRNDLYGVAQECLDLASVLMRLESTLRVNNYVHDRSVK